MKSLAHIKDLSDVDKIACFEAMIDVDNEWLEEKDRQIAKLREGLDWSRPLIAERIRLCCGEKASGWCSWCQEALPILEALDNLAFDERETNKP